MQARVMGVYFALAIILGFNAGLHTGTEMKAAKAATAADGNYRWINIGSDAKGYDSFVNYDHNDQVAGADKVDWAINYVFYNNADVGHVKRDVLPAKYDSANPIGTQFARLSDRANGFAEEWDGEKGEKHLFHYNSGLGIYCSANHIRIYADSSADASTGYRDDASGFNVWWGYFVIGSTHQDWHELCETDDKHFCCSEDVEDDIAIHIMGERKYGLTRDNQWFGNGEGPRKEGNHWWQNNGYATFVNVHD